MNATDEKETTGTADVSPSASKAHLEQPRPNADDYEDGYEPECHSCAGEGYLEANENYNDWVNYGDELVPCSNCKGTGLRKHCTVF